MRSHTFAKDSFFHIQNRGIDNRTIFVSKEDYDRFETYLYILNDAENTRAANYFLRRNKSDLTEHRRFDQLVAIGGYVLLPTSFQILMTPIKERGISQFMQKISTAYSMYFNGKYQRTGRLFEGPFKAIKSTDELHLKMLLSKIHLSPAQLFDKDWENADLERLQALQTSLSQYRYSSISEYLHSDFKIISEKYYPKSIVRIKNVDAFSRHWLTGKKKILNQ